MHTPGPWFHEEGSTGIYAHRGLRSITIAETCGIEDEAQELANARLIEAAPDLLAALEPFVAFAIHLIPDLADHEDILPDLTAGHFRAANAATTKAKEA